jgi:hypothetical protein
MLLRKRTVVVHDDSSDYSDEEDEAVEEDEEEEDVVKEEEADLREGGEQDDAAGDGDDDEEGDQRSSVTKKARISISLKGAKVCKVRAFVVTSLFTPTEAFDRCPKTCCRNSCHIHLKPFSALQSTSWYSYESEGAQLYLKLWSS